MTSPSMKANIVQSTRLWTHPSLTSSRFCEVTVTGGTLRLSSESSEAKWCNPGEVATLDLARPVKNFLLGMA
jgi:hypothetical protein